MPISSFGIRNVGNTDPTKKSNNASITWSVLVDPDVDGDATPQNVLGMGGFEGWKYLLDPSSLQSSYTFGNAKSAQFAVNIPNAQDQVSGAINTPGRVFILIPSSNQLFIFGPQNSDVSTENPNVVWNPQTVIAPIVAGVPSQVEVYIERAAASISVSTITTVCVTLFNFDLSPVAI